MQILTERELEITRLVDEECLTIKKIGQQSNISSTRASQIYQQARRKIALHRRAELRNEENQQIVSIEFTVGELVLLCRLLRDYRFLQWNKTRHIAAETGKLEQDTDYSKAGEIHNRLFVQEKYFRKKES